MAGEDKSRAFAPYCPPTRVPIAIGKGGGKEKNRFSK